MSTGLALYTSVAETHARAVIRGYSTSFGLASRILPAAKRQHIANVYALVRLADEIVDGPAAAAGLTPQEITQALDELETHTYQAIEQGFSSNLVVHAFAHTARTVHIGRDLIQPFFASMRADIHPQPHTEQSLRDYIYGSAEVVGLMCVAVFVSTDEVDARHARAETIRLGACHLGAAFQKINFLRDLSADHDGLGRTYFVGVQPAQLTETQKNQILDDIDNDIRIARASIPQLPTDSQRAVLLATELFGALTNTVRRTPAGALIRRRIRVSNPHKTWIALRVLLKRPVRAAPNPRQPQPSNTQAVRTP